VDGQRPTKGLLTGLTGLMVTRVSRRNCKQGVWISGWSSTSESAPSEARKRGSGGGSPRKYDDLLTGRSDLDVQSREFEEAFQRDERPYNAYGMAFLLPGVREMHSSGVTT
jgi:hypothetical protein